MKKGVIYRTAHTYCEHIHNRNTPHPLPPGLRHLYISAVGLLEVNHIRRWDKYMRISKVLFEQYFSGLNTLGLNFALLVCNGFNMLDP